LSALTTVSAMPTMVATIASNIKAPLPMPRIKHVFL
jgi:hypothetical protein